MVDERRHALMSLRQEGTAPHNLGPFVVRCCCGSKFTSSKTDGPQAAQLAYERHVLANREPLGALPWRAPKEEAS